MSEAYTEVRTMKSFTSTSATEYIGSLSTRGISTLQSSRSISEKTCGISSEPPSVQLKLHIFEPYDYVSVLVPEFRVPMIDIWHGEFTSLRAMPSALCSLRLDGPDADLIACAAIARGQNVLG